MLSNSRTRTFFYSKYFFFSPLCARTEFDEGNGLLDPTSDTVAVNIEEPSSRPQKQKASDGLTQDDEDPDVTDDQTKV